MGVTGKTYYTRKVHYYETDRMGIVHHSNYIRWFEEARVDFLEKIGIPYEKMEESGCFSPVLAIDCSYKQSTTFGESVFVHVNLIEFGAIRYRVAYLVTNAATGEIKAQGETTHCFLDGAGKIVSLKRQHPQWFAHFQSFIKA